MIKGYNFMFKVLKLKYGGNIMEYKVIVCKVKEMENEMNNLAKEGWRVLTVSPDIAKLYGVVIVFERNKN